MNKMQANTLYRVVPPSADRPAPVVAQEIVGLFRDGFNLTTEDICHLLCCERQWVEDFITPNVQHIFVTHFFGLYIADTLTDLTKKEKAAFSRYMYFFSRNSLEDFYRRTAKSTQKTQLVDLSLYCRGSFNDLLIERDRHKRAKGSSAEKSRHLEQMRRLLTDEGYLLYFNSRQKKEWQPTPLPVIPFNAVESQFHTTSQIAEREHLHSDTSAYNWLERAGAVRVRFGGKILWIEPHYFGRYLIPCQYEPRNY